MALLISPPLSTPTHQVARSIIALAALVALLYFGRDFFVTLIVSAIFAFILDPFVLLVMKLRVPRPLATAIVIAVALILLYVIGSAAWSQASTMASELPGYGSRIGEVIDKVNSSVDRIEKKTIDLVVPKNLREQQQQIEQKPQEALRGRRRRASTGSSTAVVPPVIQEVRIHSDPAPVLGTIYGYVSEYLHTLVMASFVPFIVYFMLSWRDHFSRAFLQLFPNEERYAVGKSWSHIGDSTRAFVLGNFLLWIVLGVASSIAFFFLGLPYWPLIGLASALFSLVPYVGLPLSLVPPFLAAVAIPNKFKIVLTALLVTAALHLIAMNFAYPKIVGRRVRLNPLIVTVAMMFWGLIWGGMGLVLAVPITAGIKAVCDNVESLQDYGRLLGD